MNRDKLSYTKALIEYVEAHLSEDIRAESLAGAGFVSRAKLYRDFYNIAGHSIKEYIRKRRLSNALALVKGSDFPLADIAYMCGYSSQQEFCRLVRQKLHMTPMEYKKSDRFYFFPPCRGTGVFDVSVERVMLPELSCFSFYAAKLKGIEDCAIKAFFDRVPGYTGRIFGRNGRQRKNKFCYELYLPAGEGWAGQLEGIFETGRRRDPYTGLFAMTTVENQEELINAAWDYLDKGWLTYSMYQYGEDGYFEEYLLRDGKPCRLRLYLSVMPEEDYPRIRLVVLEQRTVLVAEKRGGNAEQKAAWAILEHVAEYAPGGLKDIDEFYVRQLPDSFTYGIFEEGVMAGRGEGKMKRKELPGGIYLILEGEAAGAYDIFQEIIVSFAEENGLYIDEEEIFGIYYTEYGFRNTRLRLLAPVHNMRQNDKK